MDEKHRNVVSLTDLLPSVGRHLEKDGYRVRPGTESFAAQGLTAARVLIIANAQAPEGSAPGTSAFNDAEARAVEAWVSKGGGLLLIADRAPFGGPARSLAGMFRATLDDNTILRKGADGKPDGVLTIDVAADGEKSHPVFDGVSSVVYVVGESLERPRPDPEGARGDLQRPHRPGDRRPLRRRPADRARLLPRQGPRRDHRRRRHRQPPSAPPAASPTEGSAKPTTRGSSAT